MFAIILRVALAFLLLGGAQTELQQQSQNEETQSMNLHTQLNRFWCTKCIVYRYDVPREFSAIDLYGHG